MQSPTFESFASKYSLFFAALLFSLPFIALLIPAAIQGIYADWLVGLLGMLACLAMVKKGMWSAAEIPQVTFVFLGLMGIVVVQWILGMLESKQHALMILTYLLLASMLVVLGAKLRRKFGWEGMINFISWFVIAGGLVISILAITQFTTLLPALQFQHTHIAGYMAFCIVSGAYLFAKQKIRASIGMGIVVLYLGVIALVAPLLGWTLVIAIVLMAIVQQTIAIKQLSGSRAKRNLLRAALALLPVYALLQYIVPQSAAPAALTNLIMQAPSPALNSISDYMQIWQASLQMFLNAPWLGVGVGKVSWSSFLAIQSTVKPGAIGVFDNAHNGLLQLSAEMGIGALLLVVVGVIGWLRGFKWKDMTLETWWLVTILALVLVQSLVDIQLWHACFLGVTAFLLGAGEEKVAQVNIPVVGTLASTAIITCLVIALGTVLIAHHKLENILPLAQKHRLTKAEESALYDNLDWVHRKSLLAPYAELVMAGSIKINTAGVDAKAWLSESAIRIMPTQQLAYRHVLLLQLKGEHATAVDFLKLTLNAYPIKIKEQLELLPFQHWQDYLDVLSVARPIQRRKASNV